MQPRFEIIVAVVIALFATFANSEEATEKAQPQSAVQHELITEIQTNPVDYRGAIKQALQGHLSAFGLILMMRAPDKDDLPLHADALVWLTSNHASLYPMDSATSATGELIWEQPEQFSAAAEKTAALARELKAAVESGNRHLILNSLVQLGESCESCHTSFRKTE
jgi:cytochrome c556